MATTTTTTTEVIIPSEKTLECGLEFILSHFREPIWPRKVSTAATNKVQHTALDKGHAMAYLEGASDVECRISAFGINQTNPDLIFIDLDACTFATVRGLKMALTKTLNNIKVKLNGAHPTVLWSGRGYHIIQPIDCPVNVNLDNVKEFADLTDKPNDKFLQFAERYLTGNKQDSGHHPALKSCMLRVPGSHNAKCKAAGVDSKVKIMQEWNGFRPDYRLMLGYFHAYLVGKNQERYKEMHPSWVRNSNNNSNSSGMPGSTQQVDYGPIDWIEKLLQQTPIDDYRKRARDLILIPYLVVRRGMIDVDQITEIIMQWADKCAELYRLEPTRHEYQKRTRSRVNEVLRDRIPHMSLNRLMEENPELHKRLCCCYPGSNNKTCQEKNERG